MRFKLVRAVLRCLLERCEIGGHDIFDRCLRPRESFAGGGARMVVFMDTRLLPDPFRTVQPARPIRFQSGKSLCLQPFGKPSFRLGVRRARTLERRAGFSPRRLSRRQRPLGLARRRLRAFVPLSQLRALRLHACDFRFQPGGCPHRFRHRGFKRAHFNVRPGVGRFGMAERLCGTRMFMGARVQCLARRRQALFQAGQGVSCLNRALEFCLQTARLLRFLHVESGFVMGVCFGFQARLHADPVAFALMPSRHDRLPLMQGTIHRLTRILHARLLRRCLVLVTVCLGGSRLGVLQCATYRTRLAAFQRRCKARRVGRAPRRFQPCQLLTCGLHTFLGLGACRLGGLQLTEHGFALSLQRLHAGLTAGVNFGFAHRALQRGTVSCFALHVVFLRFDVLNDALGLALCLQRDS